MADGDASGAAGDEGESQPDSAGENAGSSASRRDKARIIAPRRLVEREPFVDRHRARRLPATTRIRQSGTIDAHTRTVAALSREVGLTPWPLALSESLERPKGRIMSARGPSVRQSAERSCGEGGGS